MLEKEEMPNNHFDGGKLNIDSSLRQGETTRRFMLQSGLNYPLMPLCDKGDDYLSPSQIGFQDDSPKDNMTISNLKVEYSQRIMNQKYSDQTFMDNQEHFNAKKHSEVFYNDTHHQTNMEFFPSNNNINSAESHLTSVNIFTKPDGNTLIDQQEQQPILVLGKKNRASILNPSLISFPEDKTNSLSQKDIFFKNSSLNKRRSPSENQGSKLRRQNSPVHERYALKIRTIRRAKTIQELGITSNQFEISPRSKVRKASTHLILYRNDLSPTETQKRKMNNQFMEFRSIKDTLSPSKFRESPLIKQNLKKVWKVKGFMIITLVRKFVLKMQNLSYIRRFNKQTIHQFQVINDKSAFYDNMRGNFYIDRGIVVEILLQMQSFFHTRIFTSNLYSFLSHKIKILEPDSYINIAWISIFLSSIIVLLFCYPVFMAFQDEMSQSGTVNSETVVFCIQILPLIAFLIDFIFKLNTAYYQRGLIVLDRWSVITNYIKGKMVVDFAAVMLLSILNLQDIRLLLLVSVLLIKKIQFLRIDLEDAITLQKKERSIYELAKLGLFIFMIAHFCGCLFWSVGQRTIHSSEESWIVSSNLLGSTFLDKYITSLYWAIVTMLTVGYGDIKPINQTEKVSVIIIMIISCGVYAYSLSQIGLLISQIPSEDEEFKQNFSSISLYMKKRNLEIKIQNEVEPIIVSFLIFHSNFIKQVKRYYQYLNWEKCNYSSERDIMLNPLNLALKQKVLMSINLQFLLQYKMFSLHFSIPFLKQLALVMKEQEFMPDDKIWESSNIETQNRMFFVVRGQVRQLVNSQFVVKIIDEGGYFNEKSFVIDEISHNSFISTCVSTIVFLDKKDFTQIIRSFTKDFEIYCKLRDQAKNLDFLSILDSKCETCEQFTHDFNTCPQVNCQTSKEKLIYNANLSEIQKRVPIQRSNLKDYSFLVSQLNGSYRNFDEIRHLNALLHRQSLVESVIDYVIDYNPMGLDDDQLIDYMKGIVDYNEAFAQEFSNQNNLLSNINEGIKQEFEEGDPDGVSKMASFLKQINKKQFQHRASFLLQPGSMLQNLNSKESVQLLRRFQAPSKLVQDLDNKNEQQSQQQSEQIIKLNLVEVDKPSDSNYEDNNVVIQKRKKLQGCSMNDLTHIIEKDSQSSNSSNDDSDREIIQNKKKKKKKKNKNKQFPMKQDQNKLQQEQFLSQQLFLLEENSGGARKLQDSIREGTFSSNKQSQFSKSISSSTYQSISRASKKLEEVSSLNNGESHRIIRQKNNNEQINSQFGQFSNDHLNHLQSKSSIGPINQGINQTTQNNFNYFQSSNFNPLMSSPQNQGSLSITSGFQAAAQIGQINNMKRGSSASSKQFYLSTINGTQLPPSTLNSLNYCLKEMGNNSPTFNYPDQSHISKQRVSIGVANSIYDEKQSKIQSASTSFEQLHGSDTSNLHNLYPQNSRVADGKVKFNSDVKDCTSSSKKKNPNVEQKNHESFNNDYQPNQFSETGIALIKTEFSDLPDLDRFYIYSQYFPYNNIDKVIIQIDKIFEKFYGSLRKSRKDQTNASKLGKLMRAINMRRSTFKSKSQKSPNSQNKRLRKSFVEPDGNVSFSRHILQLHSADQSESPSKIQNIQCSSQNFIE